MPGFELGTSSMEVHGLVHTERLDRSATTAQQKIKLAKGIIKGIDVLMFLKHLSLMNRLINDRLSSSFLNF